MSRPTNNFKLGIFTLVGLAFLVVALFAFGLRSYLQPTSAYETYIPGDVTGLSVGSPVELRGVTVGKVTGIDFSWIEYELSYPSYIVVHFQMRDNITPRTANVSTNSLLEDAIQRGLRARVKSKGITGTCVLSIEYVDPVENPPAQVPWTPKSTYIPSAPSEFGELISSVQKVLHNVQNLDFTTLNKLLDGDLKSAGNLLDKAGEIDFGALGTNANVLLVDLRGSNAKLKTLLQDADDTVNKAQLQKVSADLDTLINQLQDTVTRLEPGLANIDFDALSQTLRSLHRTIDNLNATLSDLKQYPSGFLFGTPPPPVKNVEPSGKQ